MPDRFLRAALAPAPLAALFGIVALIVRGHPVPGVAAAVLGAACGALPGPRGRRSTPSEPVPPGRAGDGSDELGTVLDALPLGVLVVEGDRTLGAANAMAREMFGLAIVKHIVNRHRDRLEIDSAPGGGSRFTVWLPLTGVACDAREAAGA